MNYDFIYDSSYKPGEMKYDMKREHYDSPIITYRVLFEQEGIYLEADADGNAAFFDLEGNELFRDKADGKDRYFLQFCCKVSDGAIIVRFPIQETIDHYPDCDGEYDRYSTRTIDNVFIRYDL